MGGRLGGGMVQRGGSHEGLGGHKCDQEPEWVSWATHSLSKGRDISHILIEP